MPPQTPPQRNEIVEWYQSIPPITKAIFTISVAATVAPALGLIEPYYLVLSWNALSKLQVRTSLPWTLLSLSPFLFLIHVIAWVAMASGDMFLCQQAGSGVCYELVFHVSILYTIGDRGFWWSNG